MQRMLPPLVAAALFMLPLGVAHAQRVPFFTPAGTGFDPEISVVNSGELLDAQAVVSDDLKYVTINARPSSSRLLALREFTFQNAAGVPLGFVGGAAQLPGPRRGRNDARRPTLLDRPGTTFVRALQD